MTNAEALEAIRSASVYPTDTAAPLAALMAGDGKEAQLLLLGLTLDTWPPVARIAGAMGLASQPLDEMRYTIDEHLTALCDDQQTATTIEDGVSAQRTVAWYALRARATFAATAIEGDGVFEGPKFGFSGGEGQSWHAPARDRRRRPRPRRADHPSARRLGESDGAHRRVRRGEHGRVGGKFSARGARAPGEVGAGPDHRAGRDERLRRRAASGRVLRRRGAGRPQPRQHPMTYQVRLAIGAVLRDCVRRGTREK